MATPGSNFLNVLNYDGNDGMMDYDAALIIVHHYNQLNHSLKGNNRQIRHEAQMNLCCRLVAAVIGESVLAYNLRVSQMAREFIF